MEKGVCLEGSSLAWLSSTSHGQSLIGLRSLEGSSLSWLSSSGCGHSLEGGRAPSWQMSPVNSWTWNWSLGTGVGHDGELCSPTAATSTLLPVVDLWVQTPWAVCSSGVDLTRLEGLHPALMAALPFVLLAEPPLWLLQPEHWNWRYKLKQQTYTNSNDIQIVKHYMATYPPPPPPPKN